MTQYPLELSPAVHQTRYFSFPPTSEFASSGLRLLFGGKESCRADYRIERSGFPIYLMEFILHGEGELMLGNFEGLVRSGFLFWYGPGLPCRLVNNPERPMTKLFFAFEYQGPALSEAYVLNRQVVRPNRGGDEAGKWCRLLYEEAIVGGVTAQVVSTALLDIVLRTCARSEITEAHAREPAWAVFKRAKAYIEDNFLEIRRLSDVAGVMGLDASYISRLFKRYYHLTPYNLLLQRKMDYALELLQSQHLSVQRVSELIGFSDPFHFSRTFKRVKGVSPSRFRGY